MKVAALILALGGLVASADTRGAEPGPGPAPFELRYCHALRVLGFGEPPAGQRATACDAGAHGRVLAEDGFYARAQEALERSLSAWDLPYGHLLMAKVEANLGRPLEALQHVWRAASQDGRGLTTDELEVLALLEAHLLDHELGHVVVTLGDGERLESEGRFVATGPTTRHLLMRPGEARFALHGAGGARSARVVRVRAGVRHALGEVVHGERARDPDEAAVLAAAHLGAPVDVANVARSLMAYDAREAAGAARRGDELEPCVGLGEEEAALCELLEAERRRFADRLRELEVRARALIDRLQDLTR